MQIWEWTSEKVNSLFIKSLFSEHKYYWQILVYYSRLSSSLPILQYKECEAYAPHNINYFKMPLNSNIMN